MRLSVSDFALGALFAFFLATVAIIFAFPDIIDVGLFWWLVLGLAFVAWAIGAAIANTAGDLIVQGDPETTESLNPRQQNEDGDREDPSGTSALIQAINDQARANRAQEKDEENRKQRIELVTMMIVAATGIAILAQVYEMRRVYGPIRRIRPPPLK